MFRKYRATAASGVGLLFIWMLGSELWFNTWLQNSVKVKFPSQSQAGSVGMKYAYFNLGNYGGKEATAKAGWVSFNKTYCSLEVDWGNSIVFKHLGTSSWTSESSVWFQRPRSGSLPDILTFQPLILDQPSPGEFHSGFSLWKFDGKSYQRGSTIICPLNSLLRSPLPFQD